MAKKRLSEKIVPSTNDIKAEFLLVVQLWSYFELQSDIFFLIFYILFGGHWPLQSISVNCMVRSSTVHWLECGQSSS